MSLIDDILGFVGLGSDPANVNSLIPGVSQGYTDAEGDLENGFNEAISYLEAGEAESADAILEGLGLSLEEREKWFDVASEALQPVIKFGKEYQKDARQFMDYAKELIFDPDAIYGTEMWNALKGQMVEGVTNSASAKSGLLSGNYLDELSKRVMVLGADFRNAEIGNALSGFNSAMIPVQMGFNAYNQIANNAMNVGSGNASDIMSAYSQIGGNAMNTGTNMANAASNYYSNLAQMGIDNASEIANLNLTQQLANQQASNANTSAVLGLAGSLIPSFLGTGTSAAPMSGLNAAAGLFQPSLSPQYRTISFVPQGASFGTTPYGW